MRISKISARRCLLLLWGVTVSIAAPANAAIPEFKKNSQGLVAPFKLKGVSLADFARGYSRFSGKTLEAAGPFEKVLMGSVTLLISRPVSEAAFAELFHQVLDDNGYAAVDGTSSDTWMIVGSREARDALIPVYDSTDFPRSHRMMTVVHRLKHIDSERAIRVAASYLPSNTRVVPQLRSQILITADGLNIGKILEILKLIDTEDAEKRVRLAQESKPRRPQCSERDQKIEKLVVENLEIQSVSRADSSDLFSSDHGGGK